MALGGAPGAADEAIDLALVQQHGADERQAAAHLDLGELLRDALALGHAVVGLPEVAVAVVLLDVDHVVVEALLQAQAELLDALGDDGRAADQRGPRQAFVHHDLAGTQHTLFLALGVRHALARGQLGGREDGPHDGAGREHEALQLLAVGGHVLDGSQRHTAVGRRLRHGGCDLHHQPRIERLGDEVLGAEGQLLTRVGGGHHLALLGLCELGDGVHCGDLHLVVDGGGARVERAAEDVREAEDVVDLVRVVRAAGGHDRVVAHGLHVFRQNFRVGVGQRQDQRLGRHGLDHFRLEHAACRQAQEDVRTRDHLGQAARAGRLGELDLVLVHQLGAAFVDDACQVGHPDVLARQSQLDQQAQAGEGSGTGARGHELDLLEVLADHLQAVEDGRADHDGGAVLVVVEDRDLHALAQLALDVEALRRLDVFQVDATEGGFQRGDDLDQLVGVLFVDFDVEDVDAGELLEQHPLAFHHRLGGQRADVAQTQHGGAVGDDRDQVAARGVLEGIDRIGGDFLARRRHAGRVGQGQIALVRQRLGGRNGHFSGQGLLVVLQRGLPQACLRGVGHRLNVLKRSKPGVRDAGLAETTQTTSWVGRWHAAPR